MKVKDLIKELQQRNPEAEVRIDINMKDYGEVNDVMGDHESVYITNMLPIPQEVLDILDNNCVGGECKI